jgi:hypothetical protein
MMGSEISLDSYPEIAFCVESDSAVSVILILKVTGDKIYPVGTVYPDSINCDGTIIDTSFNSDCAYMLRVQFENTDIGVCSPVWVECLN